MRGVYQFSKADDTTLRFSKNLVVLLKKKLTLNGRYVKGPFIYELKKKNNKIISRITIMLSNFFVIGYEIFLNYKIINYQNFLIGTLVSLLH